MFISIYFYFIRYFIYWLKYEIVLVIRTSIFFKNSIIPLV